jgi:hypothetical protein
MGMGEQAMKHDRRTARGRQTGTCVSSAKRVGQLLLMAAICALEACGGGGGADDGGGAPAPAPVTPPSALTYPSPQSLTVGTAIAPLTPTVTGTVTSYSVTPALPDGLSLSTSTGVISGTPATPAAQATYTVKAGNSGGSTTFDLGMTVLFERATADRADEKTGPQVHVMYVLPADAADQQLDTLGKIEGSVRSWNSWLVAQTGGKEIRLDTYGGGHLDVSYLKLTRTDAQMNVAGGNVRDKLEYRMLASGFDSVDKIYLIYYAGSGDACGRGAWPPSRQGNVSALYVLSAGCTPLDLARASDAPRYWEYLGAHEVMHPLGLAAPCAPHLSDNGHVSDSPLDLMYSGTQPWTPSTLDVNHDDYFGAANAGCPDLAASAFLDPPPAGAVLPPGWPHYNLTDDGCAAEPTVIPGTPGVDSLAMFVNDYGSGSSVDVSELVLNSTTGLYVRTKRATIPYPDGASVAAKENAVLVATVAGNCVALVHVTPGLGRFVVKP